MRRLVCEYYDGFSFGRFVKSFPHLKGTVTDLLIGDVFTDRVDKVWAPMESLYAPGKPPIPRLGRGRPAPSRPTDKANELVLPDGRAPRHASSVGLEPAPIVARSGVPHQSAMGRPGWRAKVHP